MKIINRDPYLRDNICYRITARGSICNISKNDVLQIMSPFEELKKTGNIESDANDLKVASEIVKQRHLEKTRALKMQQSGGYVVVGGLTCIGIIIIGVIAFMAINLILTK